MRTIEELIFLAAPFNVSPGFDASIRFRTCSSRTETANAFADPPLLCRCFLAVIAAVPALLSLPADRKK
ncbi:MAG TPA: hypothetical protein VMI30_03385 [Stellaceae bacterium]|nr:hypothetical protein [Stellaceae bacterium]